jgi:hypothetical protein
LLRCGGGGDDKRRCIFAWSAAAAMLQTFLGGRDLREGSNRTNANAVSDARSLCHAARQTWFLLACGHEANELPEHAFIIPSLTVRLA